MNDSCYSHFFLCDLDSVFEYRNSIQNYRITPHTGGGGVLPYMGYIGMCGAKGYGFSAVLVINRVSLLAILPPFW